MWQQVYRIVGRIPAGRVATYGQIALYFDNLSAQAIGWALRSCPEDVPWHRVVNASGGCSTDRLGYLPPGLQRALLEAEGIPFAPNGTLDLECYRWRPTDED